MFKWIKKIIKELVILVKELPTLKFLMKMNEGDEDIFRLRKSDFKHSDYTTVGDLTIVYSHDRDVVVDSDVIWVFINGIMTGNEVFVSNVTGLSRAIEKPVIGLYNPTEGFAQDLLECVLGRTFNSTQRISKRIRSYLGTLITSEKQVRIVAHSQGSIILSNIVKDLCEEGVDLSDCEFYTVGGAHDEFPTVPFAEHFGNELDYIFRIGNMSYQEDVFGSTFIREKATGHLFNRHYLEGLSRGDYCEGKSRFYGYFV